MGLGSVREQSTFLSVVSGHIWNRKAPTNDPNYHTEEFERADKTKGIRAGARYQDLTGKVTNVVFREHQEYGQSINVTIQDDSEEKFILSISTNNRYSQDMMKCLLKMDLSKTLYIRPYDFVGTDKKRAQGISFRQSGEKIDLKVAEAPTHAAEWFKEASAGGKAGKQKIKRFFEDLSDWFVAEIEEKIVPKFVDVAPPKAEPQAETETGSEETTQQEEPQAEATTTKVEAKQDVTKVTPLKMKKALRAYIAENYEGKTLPTLKGAELVAWYDLCIAEEELPFAGDEATEDLGEVDAQIANLIQNG